MSHAPNPDGSDTYHCVLIDCDWSHTQPPINPEVTEDTLATVFGPGQMLLNARNGRAQDIEDALGKHYRGHTPVEFLTTITALERSCERFIAALADVGQQGTVAEPTEVRG